MVIELRVVQFWSEIILVISNRTRAARSFNFKITRMISDQIALHSVQLPLLINRQVQLTGNDKAIHVKFPATFVDQHMLHKLHISFRLRLPPEPEMSTRRSD